MALVRIQAKYAGRCAASGLSFDVGEAVLHDAAARKCYLPGREPGGHLVREPGALAGAYRAGWEAGAPDSPLAGNPHPVKSREAELWTTGLRDRHRTGT